MGVARFPVSFELLREVLHLPSETEILFAETSTWNTAVLTVRHEDLPDWPRTVENLPLMVMPTFRRQETEPFVVFVDWGVPK